MACGSTCNVLSCFSEPAELGCRHRDDEFIYSNRFELRHVLHIYDLRLRRTEQYDWLQPVGVAGNHYNERMSGYYSSDRLCKQFLERVV